MPPVLTAIVSIAAILIVGNLLIVVHELGHYWAARLIGVTASRFVIGFGPVLIKRTDRRGTVWTLAALPLGGFVALPGERDADLATGYAARSPLARSAVILAGPATNLVLAFLVFLAIFAARGVPSLLPVVSAVTPGSAAAQAGIQVGDRIMATDHQSVATFNELRSILEAQPDEVISLALRRGESQSSVNVQLGHVRRQGRLRGYLGITVHGEVPLLLGPSATIKAAAGRTWSAITDTIDGIKNAVSTGQGTENFSGILGITKLAGEAAQARDGSIFVLIAVLSANLALMNMLPIPVLDGGTFIFCLVELARGRPTSPRFADVATRTGVVVMITVFAMSLLHDLAGFGVFNFLR